MSTETLPPLDVARAATDQAYYDWRIEKAKDNTHRQVEAAVTAYIAAHPVEPQQEQDQPEPRPLTYPERRVLDFANRRFHNAGSREQAIRDEFGYSATRYFQALGALIDRPEALAYAPLTVYRLRRIRAARQARTDTPRSTAA